MRKNLRLRKNEDFSKVIKYRNSVANGSYIIYSMPNKFNKIRIGISVSKSLGNAVIRNKIKRQIRELCSKIFDINDSYDYIIIARKGFLEKSFDKKYYYLETLYSSILNKNIEIESEGDKNEKCK